MGYWFESSSVELEVGGTPMTLETGRMAKQAAGATVVTYGGTVVLVTAAHGAPRPGQDFFPLTVDFVEKTSAAGKIPGGFFKREARLSDREILVCRFIDRSIRPLWPEAYYDEVHIVATVLAVDNHNPPDLPAFVGASTSLTVSELPFQGPIAAVRVGKLDGKLIANPTYEQMEESSMELVVAGSEKAMVMVEGGAKEATEAEILEALQYGHETVQPIIKVQEELRGMAGKPKVADPELPDTTAAKERIRSLAEDKLREAVRIQTKKDRYDAISEVEGAALKEITDEYRSEKVSLDTLDAVEERQSGLKTLTATTKNLLHDLRSDLMRERLLKDGVRIDGRGPAEVRQIFSELRPVPRAHGVALFTRGETQALVYTTLGSSGDAQTVDSLAGRSDKHFMLHYNFPPFSVGEARFLRGPSRRDIGHGNLAERALSAVMPDNDEFPYTVRVVSEVLESNGSSSMATVCGGTLALMDAGVPLKAPVAGIAMGLIQGDDKAVVLSDILGDEDHLGDMDFKVTGTRQGITALQMDIKIRSVDWTVMENALAQARDGRLHILDCMEKETASEFAEFQPRQELSRYAPRVKVISIKPDRIRDVIGPGGKVIRAIQETTNTKLDVDDTGLVTIFSPDMDALDRAEAMVNELTQEAELERVYLGKVKRITDFGAFVEIFPGTDGLIHISHLAEGRVDKVTDVVSEGDEVLAKCIEIDPSGRIRLSRKEALADGAPKADA